MIKTKQQRMSFAISKPVLSVILFVATLTLSTYSVLNRNQLRQLNGMAEEYIRLGKTLETTGSMYWEKDVPFLFRPPGYIFFIASAYKTKEVVSEWTKSLTGKPLKKTEYEFLLLAQGVLLSFSAVLMFLLMSSKLRKDISFMFSLLFGSSSYMIILVGLSHYAMLHIFLTILSLFVLNWSIYSKRKQPLKLSLSGVFWGLTTLTRPMTLIFPFFALVLFFFHSKKVLKRTFLMWGWFVLGMFLTIVPYSIRNYAISGAVIPVNCQMGTALWASTLTEMKSDPNHFRWWDIWKMEGRQVISDVVGKPGYSYESYVKNNLEIEATFRKKALDNLVDSPQIYVYNFFQTVKSFCTEINSVFVKCFQFQQQSRRGCQKKVFRTGNLQTFYHSKAANAFEVFVALLTVLGLLGLIVATAKKDMFFFITFLTFVCFAIAHAITYMDLMYYYIKMPFLFLFAAYAVNAMGHIGLNVPLVRVKVLLSHVVSVLLAIYGICLTYQIIIAT